VAYPLPPAYWWLAGAYHRPSHESTSGPSDTFPPDIEDESHAPRRPFALSSFLASAWFLPPSFCVLGPLSACKGVATFHFPSPVHFRAGPLCQGLSRCPDARCGVLHLRVLTIYLPDAPTPRWIPESICLHGSARSSGDPSFICFATPVRCSGNPRIPHGAFRAVIITLDRSSWPNDSFPVAVAVS